METETAPLVTDVSERLNDLVPYRCPKCGHQRKFATLRELRYHLQKDHSYQMGCIKPHLQPRTNVFHGNSSKTCNIKPQNFSRSRGFGNKSSFIWTPNMSSEDSSQHIGDDWNMREDSPLLDSFKADTEILERELQMAKQSEMKNKVTSMNNLTGSKVNEDFTRALADIHNGNDVGSSFQRSTLSSTGKDFKRTDTHNENDVGHPFQYSTLPSAGIDFKGTLEAMNSEVIKSRLNHWMTSDALYKSQDVLHEMEHAAEEKCKQQRNIIENLMSELQLKDKRLEDTAREHSQLSQERSRLFDETENIVREADTYNQRLQEELSRRGHKVETISSQLDNLRKQSEHAIRTKDSDLQNFKDKMERLEWERDRMLGEMEKLLQRADTDSRQLRNTIRDREQQLHKVNAELAHLRSDQQSVLERTMDVYRNAEESQDMMKTVIVAKDDQLKAALHRIEQMKDMQLQIMKESRALTDQADENTTSLKRLLQMKEDQVAEAMKQLRFLKKEKAQLEDSSSSMAEKASASIAAVENLKGIVKEKEKDLKNAQGELHNLKSYLHKVADKERAARAKLETFIEDLINRAQRAESELHALRSQSSSAAKPHHGNTADNATYSTVNKPTADLASRGDEITERFSLPSMNPPPKPPRTLSRMKKNAKETPDWRKHLHIDPVDADSAVGSHLEDKPPRNRSHKTKSPQRPPKDTVSNNQNNDMYKQSSPEPHYQTVIYKHRKGNLPQVTDESLDDMKTKQRRFQETNNRGSRLKDSANTRALDSENMPSRHKIITDDDTETILKELNNVPIRYEISAQNGRHQTQQTREHQIGKHKTGVKHLAKNTSHASSSNRPRERHSDDTCDTTRSGFIISENPNYEDINQDQSDYDKHLDMYLLSLNNRDPSTSRGLGDADATTVYNSEEKDTDRMPRNRKRKDRSRTSKHAQLEPVSIDTDEYYELAPRKYTYVKTDVNDPRAIELLASENEDEFIYVPKPRPGTIGMSRDSPNYAPKPTETHKPRKKAKATIPRFDTSYPSKHRSMVNLKSRPQNTGAVMDRQERSKRSKSLSPAARGEDNDVSSKRRSHSHTTKKRQRPHKRYTVYIEDERSDSDSVDGYEVLQEDNDSEQGNLDQIMDEHGILWDDDTLPDVSDSEFDRVSPSGSEAIATKKTSAVGVNNDSVSSSRADKSNRSDRVAKEKRSSKDDDTRRLLSEHSSQDEASFRNKRTPRSRSEDRSKNINTTAKTKPQVRPIRVVRDSDGNKQLNSTDDIEEIDARYPVSKTFRPITSETKDSSSDKEMTSGGREVHMHMHKSRVSSPVASVRAYSDTASLSLSSKHLRPGSKSTVSNHSYRDNERERSPQINAQLSSKDERYRNIREHLDETLKRITEKYKAKGSTSKFNSIDEKVKSISDKYSKRRQDIVEGKGVSPKHTSFLANRKPDASISVCKRGKADQLSDRDTSRGGHKMPPGEFKSKESIGNNSKPIASLGTNPEMRDTRHQQGEQYIPPNHIHDMTHAAFSSMLPGQMHDEQNIPPNPSMVHGSFPGMLPVQMLDEQHMPPNPGMMHGGFPGMFPGQMRYPVPPYYMHPEMVHGREHNTHHPTDHRHYKRTAEFPYIFPYFHAYSPPVDPTYYDVTKRNDASGASAAENTVAATKNVTVTEHKSDSESKTKDISGTVDEKFQDAERPQTSSPDTDVNNSALETVRTAITNKHLRDNSQTDVDIEQSLSMKEPIVSNDNTLRKEACEQVQSGQLDPNAGLTPVEISAQLESYQNGHHSRKKSDENYVDITTVKSIEHLENDRNSPYSRNNSIEMDANIFPVETERLESIPVDCYSSEDDVEKYMYVEHFPVEYETFEREPISQYSRDNSVEEGIDMPPGESTEHLEVDPNNQKSRDYSVRSNVDMPPDVSSKACDIHVSASLKPESLQEVDSYPSDNEEGVLIDKSVLEVLEAFEDILSGEDQSTDVHESGLDYLDAIDPAGSYNSVVHESEQDHLDAKEPADSDNSLSEGFSMFAEPIVDPEDASYDNEQESNTQSMLDISDNLNISGEFEQDTDTESVRRELFEKSHDIKELIDSSHSDYSDVYKMKSTRNAMSSASSQASFDIPDRVPWFRREAVKGRRQALRSVFSHLDTPTLCRAAQVCREWRIVSRSPTLWRRVELRREKISPKFLLHVARRCKELKVLILEDLRPRSRKKTETLEEYQENIHCSLEMGYEQILKRSESSLHTVSIVNCGTLLSAKCLWAASCHSRMLRHVTYLSDFDPINAEVMWALGSGCRDLKTLKVHPLNPCQRPNNLSTRCVQLIGKCFTDLETLSLGNTEVDVKALVYIAKQCRKLKYLEFDHMSAIPADVIDEMCDVGLRYLTCIRFVGTPVAPEGLQSLQENCHYLDCIYVQMTVNDYFNGTNKKEDLKIYTAEMNKLEEMQKTPGFASLLRLKIAHVLLSEAPDEDQPEEESAIKGFFKKILPF